MIYYDNETRQFASKDGKLRFDRTKKSLDNFGSNFINAAGSGLAKGLENKLTGKDKKRTLWGRITGQNAYLDRKEKEEHELKMARIKNGTDNKSLAVSALERRYRDRREDRAESRRARAEADKEKHRYEIEKIRARQGR